MRGGTSKGVYFALDDLPADEATRNALILRLVGGDARQINGLGGGDMLTAKVAVVSRSAEPQVDLDYRFIQVVPGENRVDTGPTCGNILSAVGAFAIERGMLAAADGETTVTVRDINTGARIEQVVQTPAARVRYDGDTAIAGAPDTAAPVRLYYLDFVGVKTGALFPANARQQTIAAARVTCIDAAMPCVIAAADSMGARGDESRDELQNNARLLSRVEEVRLAAARQMGMGDARGKVTPKFILVSAARGGGAVCARYFTPVTAHAAFAVSGGIALAVAALSGGTTANDCATLPAVADITDEVTLAIEHPSGDMQVSVRRDADGAPVKAGIVRTARLIMIGEARIP